MRAFIFLALAVLVSGCTIVRPCRVYNGGSIVTVNGFEFYSTASGPRTHCIPCDKAATEAELFVCKGGK